MILVRILVLRLIHPISKLYLAAGADVERIHFGNKQLKKVPRAR